MATYQSRHTAISQVMALPGTQEVRNAIREDAIRTVRQSLHELVEKQDIEKMYPRVFSHLKYNNDLNLPEFVSIWPENISQCTYLA